MSLVAKRLPASLTRGSTLRRYTTSPFSFSGFTDAASMPVVRDALVPIVIEQTVRPSAEGSRSEMKLTLSFGLRVEVNGAMTSIRGSCVNA